jgi:hypothetical protein
MLMRIGTASAVGSSEVLGVTYSEQLLTTIMNPTLIFAEHSDKNNPAASDDCRLSTTMYPADELRHVVKLSMMINVQNVQLLQRKSALLQKRDQLTASPLCITAPLSHKKNYAALNGVNGYGSHDA